MNTREQYKLAWQIVRQSTHPMRLSGMTQAQYIEFCCALISVPHSIRLAAGKSWSLREYHSADLMRQNLRDKAIDRLTERYKAEILDWDWQGFIDDAKNNPMGDSVNNYWDYIFPSGCICLGSVFHIMPSRSYAASSTIHEIHDLAFRAALDSIADSFGGSVHNGDDDPTDLFFCIAIDSEDSND